MNLYSDRLVYSKIKERDKPDIIGWYTNHEVMNLVTGKAFSLSEAEKKFETILQVNLNQHEGYFSVRLKATDQYIGIAKYIYLREDDVEIGYGMMPAFWGVGYGSEILKALITEASKNSSISTLTGIVNKENHASKKILEKHGFVMESSSINLETQYFKRKNYSAAEGIC